MMMMMMMMESKVAEDEKIFRHKPVLPAHDRPTEA
jgi:hypothetical protein